VPLVAVGDATARAAAAAGFTAVAIAGGDVAAVARLVRRDLRPDAGPLVHVAGSEVAGDLAADLAAAGFTCRRAVLYAAIPVGALSAAARSALKDWGVDGVTLFSPRTARLWTTLVEAAGLTACCRALTAFCLSPAVAAALGAAWRRTIVAARPSQAGLIDAIVGAGASAGTVDSHLISPDNRQP
jgi:uroporphyrinogen-III synthase